MRFYFSLFFSNLVRVGLGHLDRVCNGGEIHDLVLFNHRLAEGAEDICRVVRQHRLKARQSGFQRRFHFLIDFQVVGLDMDVFHAIKEKYLDDFKSAMDTDDKNVRDAALLPIMDKIAEEYPDLTEADLDLVSYKMQKYVVRRWLLDEGKRVDGRGINEIRPLAAEVGILAYSFSFCALPAPRLCAWLYPSFCSSSH